ncbi:hypothetical protein SERLA73DRAFT_66209 [Serpula lacrymans var. lacrymans S7.3]|uniref:Uncharacterized protein n=2 Tax=Serpula lacrymans var. lacrymans TaxID=341189 RepID=F8QHQ8_SERL3|nr:uncharacterized protein SERLADRAFT_436454 [Serpula lacrymans var. lacrymans S7.9]EGN92170.1 hypothetical protein SERLA73DRAFT_66209 [Serpula lacrymans var. lacrymans S7.3]EGO26647.1 hypothetical protein SERLADRAFT_436454 [Serpula lacrymans var. lacrymans S7.9]
MNAEPTRDVPSPSTASIAHRANIAKLISPLKRVRPRIPFYELAAHRVPTLWSLYRGLMKNAPGEDIKFRIRMLFELNRHNTSSKATQTLLSTGHKWLDIFSKAKQGDTRLQGVLDRYNRMIAAKREKETWKQRIRDEFDWQAKLRHRPIFKGSFIAPSLSNKLLPRLSPQPKAISGMIHKRRVGRDRRYEQRERLHDWIDDLKRESSFEKYLLDHVHNEGLHFEPVYMKCMPDWEQPFQERQREIHKTFIRDVQRLESPLPQDLLRAGKQARREKVANKTKERERERRGEVILSTIKRRRKGPPAHVLVKMTKNDKKLDRIARSPSEVGYVAAVKMKLGYKLRDPEKWKIENGAERNMEQLDRMEADIRAENERRRSKTGSSSPGT